MTFSSSFEKLNCAVTTKILVEEVGNEMRSFTVVCWEGHRRKLNVDNLEAR